MVLPREQRHDFRKHSSTSLSQLLPSCRSMRCDLVVCWFKYPITVEPFGTSRYGAV